MNRQILILDDDLDTVTLISLCLEQEGYEVISTTDPEQGLRHFYDIHPAVIILDLEMPTLSGIDFLNKIQPGTGRDFSVIILTGFGSDKNIQACYDLGVYAFITKPVQLVALKGLVRNAMLLEEHKHSLQEYKYNLEELVRIRTKKLSEEIILRETVEQQLLETNRIKDRILSILGMDLRAPLSNLVMNLSMLSELADQAWDEQTRQQLVDTYREARTTWQLTENIFHWARCQKGEIVSIPESCVLVSVVNDIMLHFSSDLRAKKLRVRSDVDQSIIVNTDRMILYLIIQNLVSNAVKYSYESGLIEISTREEKHRIILSVSDQGTGISEEILPHLMDVSHPVSTPGTAMEKGSGLGLTICSELCGIIGAELNIDSKSGEGTSAGLIFPVVKTWD